MVISKCGHYNSDNYNENFNGKIEICTCNHTCGNPVIMLNCTAIMLNYAHMGKQSYYAQNYAGIMCQGLKTNHASHHLLS